MTAAIGAVTGQGPTLSMPAGIALSNGATIRTTTYVPAGTAYATFIDLEGGPLDILGERFYLGLSGAFTTFDGGVAQTGAETRSVTLPTSIGLLGTVVFGQSIALDPAAPNGLFRISNGASSVMFAGQPVILEDFQVSAAAFTGNFSADVSGHLRGGVVSTRTHVTVAPQGVPFAAGIQSPLVPNGARQQVCLRAVDVGATGQPELVTALRWRPVGPVQNDTFQSFDLRIGHTNVVPDYSIDPFSSLPIDPDSGMSETFADNVLAGAAPGIVYQGSYDIDPADLTPGGYLPYPMFTSFAYDGASSMLLEFRTFDPNALGINGQQVYLMVQSSPLPAARTVATGGQPAALLAGQADNALPEYEIEFTRAQTFAQSPWYPVSPQTDFGAPIAATSLPAGTSIVIEYRGSDNPGVATPTEWSTSPDIAEGHANLQYRITFHANPFTGERPLIDSLVIPQL